MDSGLTSAVIACVNFAVWKWKDAICHRKSSK